MSYRERLDSRSRCCRLRVALRPIMAGTLACAAIALWPGLAGATTLAGTISGEAAHGALHATVGSTGTGQTLLTADEGVAGAPLSGAGSIASGPGAARVSLSPDGTSVYASNRFSNTLAQYSRNASTGALAPLTPATVQVGQAPEGLVVSPDGRDVYVANRYSDSVTELSRNASTGVLTVLGSVDVGEEPIGVAISPDGKNVYVANSAGISPTGTISQFTRNPETGALTPISQATVAAQANVHGIIVSPDGANVYAANYESGTVSQYSRNPQTGALTPLTPASVAAGLKPHDLGISPEGTDVYVADNAQEGEVHVLSRGAGGALSALQTVSAGSYTEDAAVSPDGNSVYATNEVSGTISVYERDVRTGKLSESHTEVGTGAQAEGIAISPDGANVYTADTGPGTISGFARTLQPNEFTGDVTCALVSSAGSAGPVEAVLAAEGNAWYAPGSTQNRVELQGTYHQVLGVVFTPGRDEFGVLDGHGEGEAGSAGECSESALPPSSAMQGDEAALLLSPAISSPANGSSAVGRSLEVTGSGQPGAQVQLLDGGEPVAAVPSVAASGQWSVSLTNLASGEHQLVAMSPGDPITSAPVEVQLASPPSPPGLPSTSRPPSRNQAPEGNLGGLRPRRGVEPPPPPPPPPPHGGTGVQQHVGRLISVVAHAVLHAGSISVVLTAHADSRLALSGYVEVWGARTRIALRRRHLDVAGEARVKLPLAAPPSVRRALRVELRHRRRAAVWLRLGLPGRRHPRTVALKLTLARAPAHG